jgi:peroxiredoxin Q/BCP
MLQVGTDAPSFSAVDHTGAPFDLTDQRGRWTLLWWYPKASTPG